MANTKSKSGSKSKSSTSKKTSGSGTKKSSTAKKSKQVVEEDVYFPEDTIHPIRRELFGLCLVALAVLLTIGLFHSDGALIEYIKRVLKGLIGDGYWLCIPCLLVAATTLIFHHGRPVTFKVTCALLVPILFGQVMYIIFGINDSVGGQAEALFQLGQNGGHGGVVTGMIGYGLSMALGHVGAIVVTLILMTVCMFFGLNGSINNVTEKVQKLTGGEYREEDYLPKAQRGPASAAVVSPDTLLTEPEQITKKHRGKAAVDIPLGDEEDDPLEVGFTRKETSTAARAQRAKVRKKTASGENLTEKVKPMDIETASAMAGVPVQAAPAAPVKVTPPAEEDGFVTYPVRGGNPAKTTTPPPAVKMATQEPAKKVKSEKLKAGELEEEVQKMEDAVAAADQAENDYNFPPVSLLRTGSGPVSNGQSEIEANRSRLEQALKSFGINSAIKDIIRGPTVTRYDIELEQGVKLSRVTNLAGDLALSLGVVNVRIAPIPDKISTVGIEVPNKIVTTVYLRDIIESPQFTTAKSKVSFAIGKDIGGNCIVGNIAKLPHLLIAGTTGSGKSVCMNSLILSILYKARPEEVKLIMVDPKMVELGIYNCIPHLYVPVVTEPKKAAGALQWSVVEMLKRYRLFSEVGVRDLEAFNRHRKAAGESTLPQVIIVIDELADLMMAASKEVEESICRIAQMGRAAGMHLVIATQRPSADVITGLMKANIPSRIAFAVSSAMESRIILDQGGAEKLIGMGDMLYAPVGSGKPTRIQGAFVSDEERESVIDFIRENCTQEKPDANEEILKYMNKASEEKSDGGDSKGSGSKNNDAAGDYDDMLSAAVQAVLEAKQCSVSLLQRKVKLGYARAARIVDQMEELGIVGPYEGAKPRQVIVTPEEWKEIQIRMGMIEDDGSMSDQDVLFDAMEYSDQDVD